MTKKISLSFPVAYSASCELGCEQGVGGNFFPDTDNETPRGLGGPIHPPYTVRNRLYFQFGAKIQISGAKIQISGANIQTSSAKTHMCDANIQISTPE